MYLTQAAMINIIASIVFHNRLASKNIDKAP
jgi:hypothetical protein